ncbi:hypothetical protein MLD38_004159 [Melastoma candidum]|uniref:Uncharacterized protein n=1 Tax=Melastoma candidum TaxID=119954 RepID=A0ACB9S660_9MYRT|nr:hypothetical protein MLD38_004159 [Melastoma candidum]
MNRNAVGEASRSAIVCDQVGAFHDASSSIISNAGHGHAEKQLPSSGNKRCHPFYYLDLSSSLEYNARKLSQSQASSSSSTSYCRPELLMY